MLRTKKSRWWHSLLLTGVLVAVALPLFSSTNAYAATSCAWTDPTHISCGGKVFTESSTTGSSMLLKGPLQLLVGPAGCAAPQMTVANYQTGQTASITIFQFSQVPGSGSVCSPGANPTAVTLTNTYASVGGGTTGGTQPAGPPTCETSGDPMSWVLCPIFNSVADASDWLFQNIITPFLITQPIETTPSTSNPTYAVWSNSRVYGDIFLVIALLVLIFGQSIGGGAIDAYTIKKALPRVLIAAILVNLSIYIVALLVDITNVVGKSIGDILIAPFQNAGSWNFSPNGIQGIGVFAIGLIGFLLAKGTIHGLLDNFFQGAGKGSGTTTSKITTELVLIVLLPTFLAILAGLCHAHYPERAYPVFGAH